MRFITAFIWLVIVIVPFIGFLLALGHLNMSMIGQGNPIANISYYILDQDPNSPLSINDNLRAKFAKNFIDFGINYLLIFLLFFWIGISLLWVVISEILKVDRPAKAIKFFWIWIILFIVSLLFPALMTWWFLYQQPGNNIYHIAEWSRMVYIIFFIIIYSGIFFYISSMFITSKVMRPAVPLLNIILRN